MPFLQSFYTQFVPLFLFSVMVAMGMSLTLSDLLRVAKQPKAVLAGLSAQLVLLPLLATGLGLLFHSPPVIAAGAIILAACPGGVTSNAYTFAARADIALSVTMTAIASIVTVFSIPFITSLALNLHLQRSEIPTIPVASMIWTLAQFTIIPVALGMAFRRWKPKLALRALEPLRFGAVIALIVVVVVGTATAWDTIVANLWTAGILMTVINVLGMACGYGIGRGLRLPYAQVGAITLEVGVQNLSMALFVTLTFLHSPELAVATLVYALVMKITALSFVAFFRRGQKAATQRI